jgi:hypothetical protein
MEYIVRFNTAGAIARMPKTRRTRERELIDGFIRVINGKYYHCDDYGSLMVRLEFIAGRNSSSELLADPENFVTITDNDGNEVQLPAQMYGFAQGYVDFDKALEPLRHGRVSVFIPFEDFYDARQANLFKGCYIEVILAGEPADASENKQS